MNKKTRMKEEAQQELKVKKKELKEKEARLSGGFSETLKRDYMAIDKEIEAWKDLIEMKTIEIDNFELINPTFKFETLARWIELRKMPELEKLENMKQTLIKVEEQKNKLPVEIESLKERINDLTNFIEGGKKDYIG